VVRVEVVDSEERFRVDWGVWTVRITRRFGTMFGRKQGVKKGCVFITSRGAFLKDSVVKRSGTIAACLAPVACS
jgi:hypothetical protein